MTIKLFHHSAGGGNTCWLQSALVVIQGEQKYIDAIQNYNNLYGGNVNSGNINDKLEAKLMKSIKNFLNDKTDQNIAEISKSYQDYVKYNNNDTSIDNQQDINVSYGGPYDSTTFLGHIEEILSRKVEQNFQENRLVLNQGNAVQTAPNINDCKYILSYTPGHWVAYKKEGDKYVEYNTSLPNQRNKYTLDEIMNKYKNTIPQYQSNYTPSKTSFHDFDYTPDYTYKNNTYDIKKYSPKSPYISELPDIQPLKYYSYYYPRQNVNYYQPYYYPYRNFYQYTPLSNIQQYQSYFFPYKINYSNLFRYYPNYNNYNLQSQKHQPYYYPYRNFYQYTPLSNTQQYQSYFTPRQNMTFYPRYRLLMQYKYPYRNFYHYQYRPIFNYLPVQMYNCFRNLNIIPSVSQSQFSHHL